MTTPKLFTGKAGSRVPKSDPSPTLGQSGILENLKPGTDAYTLGLRALLVELRRPSAGGQSWRNLTRQAQLLREWDALETAHLRLFPPLQRHRHLLILKPQLIVGNLDVMCYPFGLMMMFVLTGALLWAGLGPEAVALGCLGGVLCMWALDRHATFVRARALRSFGLGQVATAHSPETREPGH